MTRLSDEERQLRKVCVCSQVGAFRGTPDYTRGLFCLECPDQFKIPVECDCRCGVPEFVKAGVCPYEAGCPCAAPDSEERRRALALFERRMRDAGTGGGLQWIWRRVKDEVCKLG